MTLDTQTRRQYCRRAGATLTALGGAGLATTTASAQTQTEGGILADGVGEGDVWAFLQGRLSMPTRVTNDAATLADRLRNEFNANADAWIAYGNWLIDEHGVEPLGSTTVAVDVAVTDWFDEPDIVATTIDAAYDTEADEFTGLEWRLGSPESPDYEATIKDEAAANGADELAEFRRKFIDAEDGDHEIPPSEYVSEHLGRYSGVIELGPDGHTALELLLGEVEV